MLAAKQGTKLVGGFDLNWILLIFFFFKAIRSYFLSIMFFLAVLMNLCYSGYIKFWIKAFLFFFVLVDLFTLVTS